MDEREVPEAVAGGGPVGRGGGVVGTRGRRRTTMRVLLTVSPGPATFTLSCRWRGRRRRRTIVEREARRHRSVPRLRPAASPTTTPASIGSPQTAAHWER